jgi:hypothetical protein
MKCADPRATQLVIQFTSIAAELVEMQLQHASKICPVQWDNPSCSWNPALPPHAIH